MAERLEEESFGRCDAAPQFFANCELNDFIEANMDDLHGTRPRLPLEQIQAHLSQKIRSIFYEVGTRYEHVKRKRTSVVQ